MRRRVLLDDRMQREVEDRGYTIARLLSADEAADALEQVRSLSPTDGFEPDGTGRYPATYHCTFLDPSEDYRRSVDTLNRQLFEDRMRDLLDDYWMLTSNIYVKAPGGGPFEVHQNWPVTDDIRDTTLTLWCPFTDVDEERSTIQVVPRSHKIVPDIFTVTAPKYFTDIYDELVSDWLEPVPLEAGECLIFDDGLLHWSGANESQHWRWSSQLVFMPVEKTPVIYYYDEDHEPPRFEMYEVDPEYFITHEMADVARRPEGLAFHGSVERPTTVVDSDQFRRLMELGPTTRRRVYDGLSLEEAFAEANEVLRAPTGGSPPVPDAGDRPRRRRRLSDLVRRR